MKPGFSEETQVVVAERPWKTRRGNDSSKLDVNDSQPDQSPGVDAESSNADNGYDDAGHDNTRNANNGGENGAGDDSADDDTDDDDNATDDKAGENKTGEDKVAAVKAAAVRAIMKKIEKGVQDVKSVLDMNSKPLIQMKDVLSELEKFQSHDVRSDSDKFTDLGDWLLHVADQLWILSNNQDRQSRYGVMIKWILRQTSSTLEILQKKVAPKRRTRKSALAFNTTMLKTDHETTSERTRRMWKQDSRYCDELVNGVFERQGEIALVLYSILAVKDYRLRPLRQVRKLQRPEVLSEIAEQFAELLRDKTTIANLQGIPLLYPLNAVSTLCKRSHAEVCGMLGLNSLAKMEIEQSLALDLGDSPSSVDRSSSSSDITSDEDSEVDEHSTDGSQGAKQYDGEHGVHTVPTSTKDVNDDVARVNNWPEIGLDEPLDSALDQDVVGDDVRDVIVVGGDPEREGSPVPTTYLSCALGRSDEQTLEDLELGLFGIS
ncbi:hypothetical protein NKR23_g7667 [Pleurostoma richardsiae]|uniref:Uncharacterized protein n=1 Tax=Pleurostoma richardsiae TaxID=41990 RepID=A0AA38VDB5_9PEZI|nr:hypothetical protein NKR23_g7667 [Pleurostoma richardsiae]